MIPEVTAVGELLCDLLPGQQRPGGAPANFAFHVQQLGARARLISRVGNDEHGRFLLEHLKRNGLATTEIQIDPAAPTGTAEVVLTKEGVPGFAITPHVAWDRIIATEEAMAGMGQAHAIYFGSLAQRSPQARDAIRTLVSAIPPEALRIFDPNLRSPRLDHEILVWSIGAANVVKLSEEELTALAPVFGVAGNDRDCVAQLGRRQNLKAIALTRGARGSFLWTPHETAECPAIQVTVRDTVGAGDAYTAALTLGLMRRWPAAQIVQRAGEIAAFVCSQPGAMPLLPDTLRAPFSKSPCSIS